MMTSKFGVRALAIIACGAAWILPGLAEDRIAVGPPNFSADLAQRIPHHREWVSQAFCGRLDWFHDRDSPVSASGFGNYPYEPTPATVAEALTSLGLFERVPAPQGQASGAGPWYRRTDAGRAAWLGSRFCFGTRKFLQIKTIEAPVYSAMFGWMRNVEHEYEVAGMPAFTQTVAFRTAFPHVPREGAILTATVTLHLRWEPEWTYSRVANSLGD